MHAVEIVDVQPRQEMNMNDTEKISNECWLQIPEHFPNVILHEHIVMPNHIHGILELNKPVVGVENFQPLRVQKIEPQRNEYQKIISRSIGSIVQGFIGCM